MQIEWHKFIKAYQQDIEECYLDIDQQTQRYLCDLTDFSYFAITGDKALDYLQGQLTNDISLLDTDHTLIAAQCNNKGRVLALYRIMYYQQQLVLQIPSAIATTAITALNKFAKFSRVTIEPVTDIMSLAIWGQSATKLLQQTVGAPATGATMLVNADTTIITEPGYPARYQVISSQANCQQLWQQWQASCQLVSHNSWKLLNIKHGIAELWPETLATFTPHHLNLPQLKVVNFNKGCYTGQEVIARMEFRAKLKSHLYHGTFAAGDHPVVAGQTLLAADDPVGQVVDWAYSATGVIKLLLLLQDSACTK